MRAMMMMILIAVVAATLLPPPAARAQIYYPWCAQYSGDDGGGRNCGFSTVEQCMATVSGIGGNCERNLFYTEQVKPARKTKKAPRHD